MFLGMDIKPEVMAARRGGWFSRRDAIAAGMRSRAVCGFDGAVKYGDGATNAMIAEKAREDRLRDLGYQVVRVCWADLTQPAAGPWSNNPPATTRRLP
jgi:hypothetical protein